MRRTSLVWASLAAALVSACASTAPAPVPVSATLPAPDRSTQSSAALWQSLAATTLLPERLAIEAELATRGETSSGEEYLGRHTAALVGVSAYTRTGAKSGDRDCEDFGSAAQAQKFFISSGGPYADPHGLDRDGDGMACEFGTWLTANATRYRTAPASTFMSHAAPVASSQCFVGPRGGTYTITASGRKNYGGC